MTRKSSQRRENSQRNQPSAARNRLYVNRRKYLALGAGATATLFGKNAVVSASAQSTTDTYWTDFSEVQL